MDRPPTPLPRGTAILTHATLGDTKGMLVGPENLAQRRACAGGTIAGPVAGHLGEVYWVNHGEAGAPRAAYRFDEITLVGEVTVGKPADATQFGRALRARIESFFAAHANDPQVVELRAHRRTP